MIYLENVYRVIRESPNRYDEVWFITRDASEVRDFIDAHDKVLLHPELSPRPALFRRYRELAEQGLWNQEAFDQRYVPRFLSDLAGNTEGLALLRELKEKSRTKELALACFCEEERMCHRSIIGGILKNMGADVLCREEYRKYTLTEQFVLKPMETDAEKRGKAFVHWKCWHEAYPGLVSQSYLDKLTLETCTEWAFRWPAGTWVARLGERVVGFCCFGDPGGETPGVGEIFALYVLPEYHGTGVAPALMKTGLEQLAACHTVRLRVLKENARAIRFYQKCGFRFDGTEEVSKAVGAVEVRMVRERQIGDAGSPAFVSEDGRVSIYPADTGLIEYGSPGACSIGDHKNGKKKDC